MSIYASKMPFPNRDPKPFIDREDGPGREIRQSWSDGWTDYEPRPEFDHIQHNKPNPLLVEFREIHSLTGNPLFSDALMFTSDLMDARVRVMGHWDHAMRVLTKILRFSKPQRKNGGAA